MMKARAPLLLSLYIAMLVFDAAPAIAKPVKFKPKPREVARPTVIDSVTPQSITILSENARKAYAITQFTDIKLNGRRASATDLKAGMAVSVTIGLDPTTASRIDAGPPPVSSRR